MTPEMLAALAACVAALLSLINVGVTAYFNRTQQSTEWRRGLLPPLVKAFDDDTHKMYLSLERADWDALEGDRRVMAGMKEFAKGVDRLNSLESFASPRTISSAKNVLDALDAMRIHLGATGKTEGRWEFYWKYAEAKHHFHRAARKEMRLSKPPMPPGLSAYRSRR